MIADDTPCIYILLSSKVSFGEGTKNAVQIVVKMLWNQKFSDGKNIPPPPAPLFLYDFCPFDNTSARVIATFGLRRLGCSAHKVHREFSGGEELFIIVEIREETRDRNGAFLPSGQLVFGAG